MTAAAVVEAVRESAPVAKAQPQTAAKPSHKFVGGAKLKTERGKAPKWEGQPEVDTVAPPTPPSQKVNEGERKKPPLPLTKKRGKWIEFKPGQKRKDGTRTYYPKYRSWKPDYSGKVWLGPVSDMDPLTEQDKNDYVKRNQDARKRSRDAKRRRTD